MASLRFFHSSRVWGYNKSNYQTKIEERQLEEAKETNRHLRDNGVDVVDIGP